jgi:hypothetical protein
MVYNLDVDCGFLLRFWHLYANKSCSQVRQGIASNTKGTAFVVYEDVMDAKQACDKLNGFNFQNRYLVGTYLNLIRCKAAGVTTAKTSC